MNPYTPDQPQLEGDREQAFPVLEYLQVLWFRRRIIIATTLFAAIIGFIHVNELKNVYTASSTMMIGIPEMQVVDIEKVMTRDIYGDAADAEIEVLRSRGLAQRIIERLDLLNNPEFNPDLRAPEKGFFDFLRYLNPKTRIPASWKRAVREAISGAVETAEIGTPRPDQTEQRKMARAINFLLGNLGLERVQWTNVIKIRVNSRSPVTA